MAGRLGRAVSASLHVRARWSKCGIGAEAILEFPWRDGKQASKQASKRRHPHRQGHHRHRQREMGRGQVTGRRLRTNPSISISMVNGAAVTGNQVPGLDQGEGAAASCRGFPCDVWIPLSDVPSCLLSRRRHCASETVVTATSVRCTYVQSQCACLSKKGSTDADVCACARTQIGRQAAG